jgi:peptide/nickel transport system permease protein
MASIADARPEVRSTPRNPVKAILTNFWVRRFLKAIFTLWLVTTIIFFVIRLMPGNPYDLMVQELVVQRGISEDQAIALASSIMGIDFNEPVMSQYTRYMTNLLQGDMGTSFRSRGVTVTSMIAQRLPWTLFSVGISLMISFTLGITLGTIVAYKRNGFLDYLLSNLAAVMDAIPAYLTAIILFLLLGVVWKIYPMKFLRGSLSPGVTPELSLTFLVDALRHVFIPALVYVLSTTGSWLLTMKSSTIATLGEDYVTTARARGLPDSRIVTAYVGQNASLPLVTRLAISIGFVMGGSVLIEQIFTYQGIGLLLWQAIGARDYPVMQGVFLTTTIAIIGANFIADLLYGVLDPRIRTTGGGN